MIVTAIALWWLIGFIGAVVEFKHSFGPTLDFGDVLFCTFSGVLGPFMWLLMLLEYIINKLF